MAATGHFRAGKNGRVQVEAANLRLANFKVTAKGADLSTNNFESAGADQGTIGQEGSDWTMGGNWDAQVCPYLDPPGLYPRDDLGSVKFYGNLADNVPHTIAANRVISSDNGAECDGMVTFSAAGKSQGVLPIASLPAGDA